MNELQGRIWDVLCNMSGEDVARAFTSWKGNQILDDEFAEHLIDEGYCEEYELGLEREDWEEDYDG